MAWTCSNAGRLLWLGLALLLAPVAVRAQDTKWKFLVFSDSQAADYLLPINTNIFTELIEATLAEKPALVLFGGDFANTPSLANFQGWTNMMAPIYDAGIAVYPVMGNHDVSDAASFISVLGPSIPDNGPVDELDRTYFATHSNALFLMLDTYNLAIDKLLRVNEPWVSAVLATNTRPHVFAMGHVPAFKILHTDCLGSYPAERDIFWNTLSNAHCRIYFSGHDHFYDHTRLDDGDGDPENDLHQIVVGTGGGYPYPDNPYDGTNGIWTPVRILHEQANGYVSVEINGPRATSTWHRRVAPGVYEPTSEIFSYTTVPTSLRFSLTGTNLVLNWHGDNRLQEATTAHGPFSTITNASPPFRVDMTSEKARYYRLELHP